MKVVFAIMIVFVFAGTPVFAAEPELSGTLDSTVNYIAGTAAPHHSFGVEEYANLRLRVSGENFTFYSAFNLIAVSGNYLATASWTASGYDTRGSGITPTPFVYGQNYAAALELERLYFTIRGEYTDIEAGLLRLNFGYGQIWGSSDFLNPRNPLSVNARPRGILGLDVAFYPSDTSKLLFFAAAPGDPLEWTGGGFIPGLSFNNHWDYASLEALYAYETPLAGADYGRHRFGFSLKADLELGFTADALYILDPADLKGIEGLSFGAGFDYSFLDGKLYTLWEYLYNGSASSTSRTAGGSMKNHHFLYASIVGLLNDFTSAGLSAVFCFDDPSFSPSVFLDYELFQGFSLNLNARLPLDMPTPSGINEGELGPGAAGSWFTVSIGAKLRI